MSDHSRGLAIDWSVPAGSVDGKEFLAWLFQGDGAGQNHVRLRRLGISYIIWDGKIWQASSDRARTSPNVSTWRNYDASSCRAKYGSSADCAHVKHMHISLSDRGGAKQTTWWQPIMDGHRDTPGNPSPQPSGAHLEDFTGDGIADMVAVDGSGVLWLYPGRGSLTGGTSVFASKVKIGQGWSSMRDIASPGDLTGDGNADLLAINASAELVLYPGRGSVTSGGSAFHTPVKIGHGWSGLSNLTGVGDMTGDGKPDIVATDTAGRLWLYPGRGSVNSSNSAFAAAIQIGTGWSGMSRLAGPGDLDGDGHPDLIATNSAGRLILYPGRGTVTSSGSALKASVEIGLGWSSYLHLAAPGDLDGDGAADIVGVDASGNLRLYQGRGHVTPSNSAFHAAIQIGHGWSTYQAIAV